MKMAVYVGNKPKRPFFLHLSYFVTASFVGFLALRSTTPRSPSSPPTDLDYFFTSVSATTLSSLSVVDMEAFSDLQLVIITVLMFSGWEVFTSLISLQLRLLRFRFSKRLVAMYPCRTTCPELETTADKIADMEADAVVIKPFSEDQNMVFESIKWLAYVVSGYLLAVHGSGFMLVFLYSRLVSSVRGILNAKAISIKTFSALLTVSTITNCGFAPNNENMTVFKKNSSLLLILIPQALLGNTLYPPCLRAVIWVLGKLFKQPEFGHILKYHDTIGYDHLLPALHSNLLVLTLLGFILLQFALFSEMEWGSQVTAGLNTYQKIVAVFFQVVSTRHSGESTFDLSTVSSAIWVLFIVMMYLPPYTTFFPSNKMSRISQPTKRRARSSSMECLLLSPLSYLAFFVFLACIIEREKLRNDPLNFNVLNITIEVISAYGNVGYSMGYSCELRLNPTGRCEEAGYGFVGRWSMGGKIAVIFVMYFGRLKKFFISGGKAWKLS